MNSHRLNAKILLISDNAETAQLWAYALGQKGLAAVVAPSAEAAQDYWTTETFDLTVIDVYSPQMDGLELCRRLRAQMVNPILLFTYCSAETHLLAAYQAGVDECIARPVSPPLFLAKVLAWLRRSWTVPAEALDSLQAGSLRLDPVQRHVSTTEELVIRLTNLEFRLLHLLMSHSGQALENDLIVARVWGYAGGGDSAALKNLVYRLRRKIEPDPNQPRYLQTASGEGYLFQPQ